MNQTHNLQGYSFVQPINNRVNLTSKPATADNRHSPSPFKVQRRELVELKPEQGRSPIRRHFSTISPIKEGCASGPYRAYSSKIEGVPPINTVSITSGTIGSNNGPPLNYQPPVFQLDSNKKPDNTLPMVEQIRSLDPNLPPRPSSKIIEERKKDRKSVV